MKELYLNIGSKELLNTLIDENKDLNFIRVTKANDDQRALISFDQLSGTYNPLVFDVLEEYFAEKHLDNAQVFVLTYLQGEDDQASTARKYIQTNTQYFEDSGAGTLMFLQEKTDMKRFVLMTAFENLNDMQRFIGGEMIQGIQKNFYSSFNVLYTKGFKD